jgi:predicted small integral membrane protein
MTSSFMKANPMSHPGLSRIALLKSILVGAVGLWALLVALGNVMDYGSNWQFVQHVLAMDTVFPDNRLRWRAITDPRLQQLAYLLIIAWQWLMALTCLAGAWRLLSALRACGDRHAFIAAKALAATGLVLVILLYYVGFVVIGGEWFSMWQSTDWNGQGKAAMFAGCATAALIVLLLPEEYAGPSQV